MAELPLGMLGELGKLGLLGVMTALWGWIAWTLLGRLNASWAERVVDWKELGEIVKTHAVAYAEMTSSNDARTRAAEALARAHEMGAAAQATLVQENVHLRATVNELRIEVARLRDVILQKERS